MVKDAIDAIESLSRDNMFIEQALIQIAFALILKLHVAFGWNFTEAAVARHNDKPLKKWVTRQGSIHTGRISFYRSASKLFGLFYSSTESKPGIYLGSRELATCSMVCKVTQSTVDLNLKFQ